VSRKKLVHTINLLLWKLEDQENAYEKDTGPMLESEGVKFLYQTRSTRIGPQCVHVWLTTLDHGAEAGHK